MISKINIYFLWDKMRSKIYGSLTFWKIVWKNQFLIIVIKNRDPYPSKTKLCLCGPHILLDVFPLNGKTRFFALFGENLILRKRLGVTYFCFIF